MGTHPINLAVRFMLELIMICSVVMWGWKQSEGLFRFVLAFGIPLLMMVIWGVFAVPDDPSRSGNAPIPTNGFVRLLIELTLFYFSVWVWYNLKYNTMAIAYGLAILVHYLLSYDRILWLIKQ